jgi:hypothetical protein
MMEICDRMINKLESNTKEKQEQLKTSLNKEIEIPKVNCSHTDDQVDVTKPEQTSGTETAGPLNGELSELTSESQVDESQNQEKTDVVLRRQGERDEQRIVE